MWQLFSSFLWAGYPTVNASNTNQRLWTWVSYTASIFNLLWNMDLFTIPDILSLMPFYLLFSLFIYFPSICLQIRIVLLATARNSLGFSSTKSIYCLRNPDLFYPFKIFLQSSLLSRVQILVLVYITSFVFLSYSPLMLVRIVYLPWTIHFTVNLYFPIRA